MMPCTLYPRPSLPPGSHRQAEAAAALGAPEFAKGLLDGTGGVESLRQQQDAIEEEKGRQAIDHVLEILDAERREARSLRHKPTGWWRGVHKTKNHLQGGQDLKILNVAGKVRLHQDFSLGQSFVPATTEQCHAGIAQQGGHQGGVGHCPNAPDTAIITT